MKRWTRGWDDSDRTCLSRVPRLQSSSSWRPSVCELLPIDMPTTHSDTETRRQLDELELVYQSILSYRPLVSNPPILDSSLDAPINQDSDHISGLRPLLEAVKRDLDVAKQVQPAPCSL